jgi:hypothetical protein
MDYPLFEESFAPTNHTLEHTALMGNLTRSPLSDLFFSTKNIDILQDAVRYQVYVRSDKQHIIDKQSSTELHIIMRSIYIEYARHVPYDVVGQVRVLNTKVLDYCVDNIISEINMRMHYVRDVDQVPIPLSRSPMLSSAGTKTLIMKEF